MRSLVVLLLLLIPLAVVHPQNNPGDDAYDIQDKVLIKTRDGDSISAIVVRQKGNTRPLPTILFYTTYEEQNDVRFGKKAVDKGYVGIVAYTRGIRTNLDHYMPYENDGRDIYDVIDWISKQSWSDGRVGMYGGSYTGFSQWSTVKHVHPALKTIVPQVAVMPGYDTPIENGVCISVLCLAWPNSALQNKALPQDLYTRWYAAGSSYRSLDTFAGQPNRIFQKWLQHPSYDQYWQALVPTPQEYAALKIPVLSTTGYYDDAQLGALRYLKLHYQANPKAEHYLIIGPFNHRGAQRMPSPTVSGYQIDAAARINIEEIIFQWFDYVLKRGTKPEILKDRINYEVMGGNQWRHAPSLAAMKSETLKFYLSDRGQGENHSLTTDKPASQNFLNQTVDFKDRQSQNNYFTPTIINDSLNASGGLVLMTEPFAEPLILNGWFSGQLQLSINKRDLDISIAFYELMPDGKYFYLTRFLGRASYARNKSERQLIQPGEKTAIPFEDMKLISKQFSTGSRLVIVLNANKHPFEIINYGTGKDPNDETISDAKEPLQIKWFNDSYLNVPILRIK